jgi:small-conductance mechanosensitive channel
MGLDLSNLALIAGALSVGIGFGLQNVVNNFVSGLILLVERPIKVGDWVLVGGHEGFVKQIKVRATEIETFQRASVIIPNSEFISNAVTNLTHKDSFGRVDVSIGVAYGSDVNQVMEVLKKCLRENSSILEFPEPFVLFQGFGDSSLDFETRAYIPEVSRIFRVSSEVRVAIYTALAEAGIEIPFPQRDVHIKSLPKGLRNEAGESDRPD